MSLTLTDSDWLSWNASLSSDASACSLDCNGSVTAAATSHSTITTHFVRLPPKAGSVWLRRRRVRGFSRLRDRPEASRLGTMLLIGVVREFLWALGGLGFVSLVLALFVVLARFAAKRLLDENDGSSLR